MPNPYLVETDWGDLINMTMDDDAEVVINSDETTLTPPFELVFKAFTFFNINDLRVVILGQDPYINKGEAMGLAFSVPTGTKCPPSLRNIFIELKREYGVLRKETDLSDWAHQGVLLLNTALTTRIGKSRCHTKVWKSFTETILKHIAQNNKNVVFMLWGEDAKVYAHLFDKEQNLVLTHSHPSPLSRKPFVGCGHFSQCNKYLEEHGFTGIKWV